MKELADFWLHFVGKYFFFAGEEFGNRVGCNQKYFRLYQRVQMQNFNVLKSALQIVPSLFRGLGLIGLGYYHFAT